MLLFSNGTRQSCLRKSNRAGCGERARISGAIYGLSASGLNQETADAALQAVSLLHRLPVAHFNLGVAMARSGETKRAMLAFETALRFRPDFVKRASLSGHIVSARRWRSEESHLSSTTGGKYRSESAAYKKVTTDRSEQLFDLPEIPNREERLKILLKERPDPKGPEPRSGKNLDSGFGSASLGNFFDDANAGSRRCAIVDR